jgi:fumarate hydratase class II
MPKIPDLVEEASQESFPASDPPSYIYEPPEHANVHGPQTQRSAILFRAGGSRFLWRRAAIRALGIVKKCAALANRDTGQLPADTARRIAAAAEEIIRGSLDAAFPIGIFQSGSGTQTNMNANEVIARLAGVHPNDDANRSQSSNDVIPSVMHIAAVLETEESLLPAVRTLRDTLTSHAHSWDHIVMLGRTHLRDAVPVTFGQVAGGWAAQLDCAITGIQILMPRLCEVPLGGTAVGTGLNAPVDFGTRCAAYIAQETGQPFSVSGNRFAAISAHDELVRLSGALRVLAAALFKIANDIRWYSSGPRSGIGELTLPEREPGSSIMPGKVNPAQCESLMQIAVHVYGNDAAVAFAGSQGNFQLNTFNPVMLHNLLESIELLAAGCRSFDEHCARGLEPDRDAIARHVDSSLMLVTALSPHIGYEKSAEIARLAEHDGITLREAAGRLGYASAEDYDRWVKPQEMTHGL